MAMVKMSLARILGLLFLLLLGSFGTAFAALLPEAGAARSVTSFEILEDAGGRLDFASVRAAAKNGAFHKYPQEEISLGISRSVFWLRFRLPVDVAGKNGTRHLLEFANPSISKIDLYLPVTAGGGEQQYREKYVGLERLPAEREVWDASWVFFVPKEYAAEEYIYLRLESISTLRLPVLVWEQNAFLQSSFQKNIGYGIFYGILIAVFLYNLFIAFVLQDRTYGYYVFYTFFMFIYQFDAHGHGALLFPLDYPLYNALFWISLAAAFSFSVLFTASFLQVYEDERIWPQAMQILLAVSLAQGGLGAAGYSILANQIANGLGIVVPVCFMTLAVYRLCQGFRPALYYLLAWGILSLGIVIWILSPYRDEAAHILMFASAAEAILLSLALSDRFKTLRLKELTLRENVHYYRDLSVTDELTGLYNRRQFKKQLRQEIAQADETKSSLAIVVLDIDFFKRYNDTYGHWQGDQVLMRFSQVLLRTIGGRRPGFRFGGEEFVVLLPSVSAVEAAAVAEQIRLEFAAEVFWPQPDCEEHVTVSAGLSVLQPGDTEESLFERADKALYQAKEEGRNRLILA